MKGVEMMIRRGSVEQHIKGYMLWSGVAQEKRFSRCELRKYY